MGRSSGIKSKIPKTVDKTDQKKELTRHCFVNSKLAKML
jgi:hypothetical protein